MKLPTEMTLQQIAHVLGGRVEGPSDLKVGAVAASPFLAGEDDLALVFDDKAVSRLADCKAKAIVVAEGAKTDRPRIIVNRPMLAIQKMLSAIAPQKYAPIIGVHPSAVVDESAEIAETAAIGPLVVVGPKSRIGAGTKVFPGAIIGAGVLIGEDTVIGAGCLLADDIKIGNRVILQQGASIGSDGFGYVTEKESNLERRLKGSKELVDESNPHLKIPQLGTVIIEDDVEIGSNTTIDRGTMGATIVGRGTKIDNLVMIAHNVRIGQEVLIIAHTGVGGSSVIGDRAIISGLCAISDHVKIGKDAIIEGCSGVMTEVPDGSVQVGVPAVERRQHVEGIIRVRKLGKTNADVKELKDRVSKLEALLAEKSLVKG